MKILLLRLLFEGEVVGYQRQENGLIFHINICEVKKLTSLSAPLKKGDGWFKVTVWGLIKHDRIDMWTGVTVAGAKLFERDRLKIDDIVRLFTVQYHAPAAMWVVIPDLVFIDGEPKREALINYIESGIFKGKITGIEGVKDERSD